MRIALTLVHKFAVFVLWFAVFALQVSCAVVLWKAYSVRKVTFLGFVNPFL